MKKSMILVFSFAFGQVVASADFKRIAQANNALFAAIIANNFRGAQDALDRGANVNAVDKAGYKALILAAIWGRDQIVKMLLDRNANVDAVAKDGTTALIGAANNNRYQIVKMLFDRNANVDAVAKDGSTALIWAVIGKNDQIVKMLLDRSADVNAVCKDGTTALSWAKQRNYFKIIKMLLRAGEKIKTEEEFTDFIKQFAQIDCVDPDNFLQGQEKKLKLNSNSNPDCWEVIPNSNSNDPDDWEVVYKSDSNGPGDWEVVSTLKATVLKKMYEDYYHGYPQELVNTVGYKTAFSTSKERYFKPEFLEELYEEYNKSESVKTLQAVGQGFKVRKNIKKAQTERAKIVV